MNKTVKIILVCIVLVVLLGVLLWLNDLSAKCRQFHTYSEKLDLCYYESSSCSKGEDFDGKYCNYKPIPIVSGVIIFLFFLFLVVGIIIYFIVKYSGKKKKEEDKLLSFSEFNPKDRVSVNRAKELLKQQVAIDNNIYYVKKGDEIIVKPGAIEVTLIKRPFIKKNFERFCKFEIEINEGKNIGIYTALVSLSQGEDWIKGGDFVLEHVGYDDWKENHNKTPLYQLRDPKERYAEFLIEQGKVREAEKVMFVEKPDAKPLNVNIQTPEERYEEMKLGNEMRDNTFLYPNYRRRQRVNTYGRY